MVLWILAGTAWGAPKLPMKISGDQLREFREAAVKNKNFVLHIRQGIMNLMTFFVSEYILPSEDEVVRLEHSLNLSPVYNRSCTWRNFQVETCLLHVTNVLQQYHEYLRADVVERRFHRKPQEIESTRMDVNRLRSNVENLLRLLDINPVPTRIEPGRLIFEDDDWENAFVYSVLKRMKSFITGITGITELYLSFGTEVPNETT
ncbi:uncharacterized protein LOC144607735 [Rhinoraja longicauda]